MNLPRDFLTEITPGISEKDIQCMLFIMEQEAGEPNETDASNPKELGSVFPMLCRLR